MEPHERTIDAYQRGALGWERRRSADTDGVEQFARDIGNEEHGPVVDLGCGPGWHLPSLPHGAIAMDATPAMLERVAHHSSGSPRVLADLRALPFARASLAAAWASRSYVHLRRSELPMALWDLHRSLAPQGRAHLVLFEGDLELGAIDGDDLPGRSFSAWPEQLLRAVVEGAGFELELFERRPGAGVDQLHLTLRRRPTLADTVAAGMGLLLVGLNPSIVSAEAGVGFHRRGNRAWPALASAGLATRDRDPQHLLRVDGIGMTDLVKRATARAAELTRPEYAHGVRRLELLCSWLRPRAVCVVGLSGWRAALDPTAVVGIQQRTLGGRPVYLMPNPSGVNAHVGPDELAEHLRAAARLAASA